MLDKKIASNQLTRISHMYGFSKEPAAVRDLMETIQKFASTDLQAKEIIDRWIESPRMATLGDHATPCAPSAYELAVIGRQMAEERQQGARKENCRVCGNSLWMQAWELHTWDRTGNTLRKDVARISREEYADLLPKVGYKFGFQAVVECAARCTECVAGRAVAGVA